MLLVLRAFLLLGFASLACASRHISVKLKQGNGSRGKTVRVVLDSSVLIPPSSRFASHISNASLSPWIYRETCVSSRLPRIISEARCLTSGCLSPERGGEDLTLEVKPIQYEILVLHKIPRQNQIKKGGKRKKRYDFILGTQVITVGCTCVKPITLPMQ